MYLSYCFNKTCNKYAYLNIKRIYMKPIRFNVVILDVVHKMFCPMMQEVTKNVELLKSKISGAWTLCWPFWTVVYIVNNIREL